MRTEVRNQIEMLDKDVAAEIPRQRASHRRWVRLGPSDGDILLLEVEVPVTIDPTEYAKSESDYVVVSSQTFSTLDLALADLDERGIDTDAFDAVWKFDNPF